MKHDPFYKMGLLMLLKTRFLWTGLFIRFFFYYYYYFPLFLYFYWIFFFLIGLYFLTTNFMFVFFIYICVCGGGGFKSAINKVCLYVWVLKPSKHFNLWSTCLYHKARKDEAGHGSRIRLLKIFRKWLEHWQMLEYSHFTGIFFFFLKKGKWDFWRLDLAKRTFCSLRTIHHVLKSCFVWKKFCKVTTSVRLMLWSKNLN